MERPPRQMFLACGAVLGALVLGGAAGEVFADFLEAVGPQPQTIERDIRDWGVIGSVSNNINPLQRPGGQPNSTAAAYGDPTGLPAIYDFSPKS